MNGIAFALALALFAACGGQSLVHSDDGDSARGGSGGTSGDSVGGTGNAGASGSFTGGTLTGGSSGTSFGGTSAGGRSAGGRSAGGRSAGGRPAGGTSAGGTGSGAVAATTGIGGGAGAGGVCSLPLVTGACDAYFPSYGFSQADGNCQPFIYGGCQGNDNRFSTLAECEAKCGGSLSECPERMPAGSCSSEDQTCAYDYFSCLCAPQTNFACPVVDERCHDVDAGVSPIIVVAYTSCTCADAVWGCRAVTTGGR